MAFNKENSLKKELLNFWWVLFFALICFICYEQGIKVWRNQFNTLNAQLQDLQVAKSKALLQHERLQAQVQSQKDIHWIELTLIKELGVVPEGHKKVFFTKSDGIKKKAANLSACLS